MFICFFLLFIHFSNEILHTYLWISLVVIMFTFGCFFYHKAAARCWKSDLRVYLVLYSHCWCFSVCLVRIASLLFQFSPELLHWFFKKLFFFFYNLFNMRYIMWLIYTNLFLISYHILESKYSTNILNWLLFHWHFVTLF